ncbi:MAG: ISNCY family transposase [Firmicutes bacterium]|nr:ISNCY family transposase [Bacillota bacterium]
MNRKESRRLYVMEQVLQGKLTIAQAAQLLDLSERQVKRLKGGMKVDGAAALAHKNRGRKPKHAVSGQVRDLVIHLAMTDLAGASCEHMAELLAQHHAISLSPRTIRRIIGSAGIHNPHAHKRPARRRRSRTRMPQEGLLVQMDASPYAWLEERGPRLSLHGAIDDATSKILGLWFRPQEDLVGYLHVTWQIVQNHGIPVSLYCDGHTIFFSPKKDKLTIEEELAGQEVALTRFGEVLQELGVNHIEARSPQARGRVERLWGTLQGRLVIEMRLAGISTLEDANAFLPSFICRFNQRFAVEPADSYPAYSPTPPLEQLERTICLKDERKASNGSVISFSNHSYQLTDKRGTVVPLRPKSDVTVLTHLDGSLSALYNGKHYGLQLFTGKKATAIRNTEEAPKPPAEPYHPAPDHPWRKQPLSRPRRRRDPVQAYFDGKDPYWEKVYAET